jgi:pimeloyl-ACP methyl ester carboxylesterase
MGGGIAVSFSAFFPNVPNSVVLLAPSGLIRPESFGLISRIVFSTGIVPDRILAAITSRRLQQPIASSKAKRAAPAKAQSSDPRIEVALAEVADPAPDKSATPFERRVLLYVRWMVRHHAGFVPAFMSCIPNAPLTEQHDKWRHLARRKPGTTAILFGRHDEIIDEAAYRLDGLPLAGGEDNVAWKVLPGGHDFVMTHHKEILATLDDIFGE